MDDDRIAQLRRKKNEDPEAFKARFGLSDDEFEKWKELTSNGTKYTGMMEA
jgi:hypothetical protein